jgi:hypothetical protein
LTNWLDSFPEDTIVEFAIQQPPSGYDSYGRVDFSTPNLENNEIGDGWEFLDFRNNQFVKPEEEHFGKTYLRIGESH